MNDLKSTGAMAAIIVGGGIAGLSAAARLADLGLRATVLERSVDEAYLCNTRLSSGVFHCALNSISKPAGELEQAIAEATGGTADPGQAGAIAADALRAVRWLQQCGNRFIRGSEPYHDFTLAPPNIDPRDGGWRGRGGDVLLRTLEARLVAAGGQVLRGHRARRLRIEAGRCVGVEGERADGSPFRLDASAVIIADGGFQSDLGLLGEAITREPAKIFQRNARSGLGDGLRMARDAGAAISGLGGFYGHMLSADAFHNDRLWPHLWLDFVAAAGVLVDREGLRFTDEGQGGVSMVNRIAAQADPLGCFVIADQVVWAERGRFNMQAPNPRLRMAGGTMHEAPTLRELARLAGIDPDALERTVTAHNTAVQAGLTQALDPQRSVNRFRAYALQSPPFIALPACAGVTYTMGGILIDADSRALDAQGRPLPGLYAAGAATGGLEGGGLRVGYVGGLLKSTVTGLRAAEDIARQSATKRDAA